MMHPKLELIRDSESDTLLSEHATAWQGRLQSSTPASLAHPPFTHQFGTGVPFNKEPAIGLLYLLMAKPSTALASNMKSA